MKPVLCILLLATLVWGGIVREDSTDPSPTDLFPKVG